MSKIKLLKIKPPHQDVKTLLTDIAVSYLYSTYYLTCIPLPTLRLNISKTAYPIHHFSYLSQMHNFT